MFKTPNLKKKQIISNKKRIQNVSFLLRFFPSFKRWENFCARFFHLFVCHVRLRTKLWAHIDVFFHWNFVYKFAIVIAIFAIIFIDCAIFIFSKLISWFNRHGTTLTNSIFNFSFYLFVLFLLWVLWFSHQ